MTNELTALEKATAVRDGINAKLEAAKHDLKILNGRRDEIAFAAHTGDVEAEKKLKKVNEALLAAVANIDSLSVACIEASRRIDDAHRAEAAEADSEDAAKAMVIAAGLGKRAVRIDKALAVLADEANAFKDDLRVLNHQLGCSHPNEFQLESLGERAVKAALMGSPFRWEHLAPRERYSFVQLADGWCQQIERWCEGRLPANVEAAE